jgi:acid phosphatase
MYLLFLQDMSRLLILYFVAAAEAYNHALEHLDKKVSKYIDGNPIRLNGRPRASGVLDTVRTNFLFFSIESLSISPKIRAAVAHGIKVPPEFEDKSVIDLIVRIEILPFVPLAYRPFLIRKKQL